MDILAVETGTSLQSIALLREDRVLAHFSQEAKGSHTKILVPAIHEVLSSQSLKPSDLNGLAVSIVLDQSLLAAPQDFSQPVTSFIASRCLGIHQMLLIRLIISTYREQGQRTEGR